MKRAVAVETAAVRFWIRANSIQKADRRKLLVYITQKSERSFRKKEKTGGQVRIIC